MRLFISHAATDLEVAEALRLRLEEIPGLNCFLLATDIGPGDDWEARIRRAAQECDAIACLVTPEYRNRPWFYAEWAAFWFQGDKTWFLLLLDSTLDDVFEVMRRRQSAFLTDRRSVEQLFRVLATAGAPSRGLDLLADETVRAVADARLRSAEAMAEADLNALTSCLQGSVEDVQEEYIDRLLTARRSDDIVQLARNPRSNRNTKKRQLAQMLVQRGLADIAGQFDDRISNGAERRTLGFTCLDQLKDAPDDKSSEQLALKIYRAVRDPQRRELRDYAADMGIPIDWAPVEPNP